MPNSLEEKNKSKGIFSILEKGSKYVFDESVKSRSAPPSRKKSLSGSVQEMVSDIVYGSGSGSPTGGARLSAIASQHLHIADKDRQVNGKTPLPDGFMFRKNAVDDCDCNLPPGSALLSPTASPHEHIVDNNQPRNRHKSILEDVRIMEIDVDGSGRRLSTNGAWAAAARHGYIVDDDKRRNRKNLCRMALSS